MNFKSVSVKMSAFGLLSLSLATLAGCSGNSDSKTSNGQALTAAPPTPAAPPVIKTIPLYLLAEGSAIDVTAYTRAEAEGANVSKYKFQFNSGNNASIKVLALTQKNDDETAACDAASDKVTLESEDMSFDISTYIGNKNGNTLGVLPNTDYTITVTRDEKCVSADFSAKILVAASKDQTPTDPNPNGELLVGRRCMMDQLTPVYFLSGNEESPILESERAEDGTLIGGEATLACGVQAFYSDVSQKRSAIAGLTEIPVKSTHSSSDRKNTFTLEFDAKNQFTTGTMSCASLDPTKNAAPVTPGFPAIQPMIRATHALSACQDVIVKYTF